MSETLNGRKEIWNEMENNLVKRLKDFQTIEEKLDHLEYMKWDTEMKDRWQEEDYIRWDLVTEYIKKIKEMKEGN